MVVWEAAVRWQQKFQKKKKPLKIYLCQIIKVIHGTRGGSLAWVVKRYSIKITIEIARTHYKPNPQQYSKIKKSKQKKH